MKSKLREDTTKRCATAKAKLLRDALRCATGSGASAQAQALLATLIAESWPEDLKDGSTGWVATMGYPLLRRRLNTSQASIRRWCNELLECNLVIKHPGDGRRITRWLIARDNKKEIQRLCNRGCSPVSTQGAHPRPRGCSPVSTQGAHPRAPFSDVTIKITPSLADDGPPAKAATVVGGAGGDQDLGLTPSRLPLERST